MMVEYYYIRVDDDGKVTVPEQARKLFGWRSGTSLRVAVDRKTKWVILEQNHVCPYCGSDRELVPVGGGLICHRCLLEASINDSKSLKL